MLCGKYYKNCITTKSIKKNSKPEEHGFCQDYQRIGGITTNKQKKS